MIYRFYFFLLLSFYAAPSFAKAPLAPQTCEALTSATYQAGIDVNGNDVVSADLGTTPNLVPDEIKIPLTIDVMHYLESKPDGLGRNDAAIGTLTIKGNDVYLNEVKLNQAQQNNLSALCEHN